METPKIKEQNDFVDVEFIRPAAVDISIGNRIVTTDYDRLSLEEKKLLLYLTENKKITRKQAVDFLKLGETKVKELFNFLLSKQLIKRNGQGRSTFYTLVR